MDLESKGERYILFNSLSILLKAVENERTTVDLRNEASVYGTVEHADAQMNIVMRNCVFTDPRGDSYNYDLLFVQARNIRFVHIPPEIRIIPAIKEQLRHLYNQKKIVKDDKRTFKMKRSEQRQQEGRAMVEKILEDKKKAK
ncbi:U7 snRNA-associated Sm-like protein LSm10 [Hylaeus anthracinus]|uniref:U7 snRNA-associated Sm-like protein LSm10 n=1 Tax=Hylaeus volcanicus TaxID=313075 RepID=UPI0023B85468|nr:U7 snRNA-associated Sm-like protein LSm10 [Hylaeus volcanicus]XP_053999512.1 U7 snRNA-associated Sm-like protein LSm10 [Hylaeus anthracinus]